jgi:ABC-2 type transport system permease protein
MTTRSFDTAPRTVTGSARRITAQAPSSTLPVYTMYSIRKFSRSGIIWAISFALYVAMIVLIYPSFRDSGALDAVENYPDSLKEAFGFEEMTSIGSFMFAEVYSYAPLVLAFFPIMSLSSAIAGAEERNGLDILLGNPMPRRHLVLASWISMAALLLGIVVSIGIVSWLSSLAVDAGLGFSDAMSMAFTLYPITLAFGSLALLLSARFRSRGMVIGITFGFIFLMYLFDVVGKIASGYDWLRWGSAFRFYDNAALDGFSWGNAALVVVVAVALLAVSIPVFDRRDIYT